MPISRSEPIAVTVFTFYKTMETKTCTRCKIEQDVENYYVRRTRNNQRKAMCKECESKQKARPLEVVPDLENEIWLDVVGYEKIYVVSNMGRVKRIMHRKNKTNTLMTSCPNKKGYHMIRFSVNGKAHTAFLSRVVAIAHIPNPENKPEVNHLFGKDDNRVQSLEWSTTKENIHHAWRTGLSKSKKGENHNNATLTEENVLDIRASTLKPNELASIYEVNVQAIYKILSRKRWNHI